MKKFFLGVFLTCYSTTLFAFYQTVSVCLNIIQNSSPYNVNASFVSSDIFDGGSQLSILHGTKCVEHTYRLGPKNITLALNMDRTGVQTKILPDKSCDFLTQSRPAWFTAEKIKTTHPHELWSYHINQVGAQDGYEYVYRMSCNHLSY